MVSPYGGGGRASTCCALGTMGKLCKLVDPDDPGTLGTQYLTIDWDKYVLCQEGTKP